MRMLLCLAVVLLAGTRVDGHHSFAAYYFEDQTITLEGDVLEFDYRAPHAWVHFTAADPDGRMQRFAAEWSTPNRLARDGVMKDTLKAGDRVVITGSPGRTASERKVHLKRISRAADGWEWRGGRPAAGTPRR